MEYTKTATKLISKGAFMAKIDLKDAYFAIPVDKDSRKCLGLIFEKKNYLLRCLPFGIWTAPWIFTMIMKPEFRTWKIQSYIVIKNNSFDAVMHLCSNLQNDFDWRKAHIAKSVNPVRKFYFSIGIFSDASLSGSGANCKNHSEFMLFGERKKRIFTYSIQSSWQYVWLWNVLRQISTTVNFFSG